MLSFMKPVFAKWRLQTQDPALVKEEKGNGDRARYDVSPALSEIRAECRAVPQSLPEEVSGLCPSALGGSRLLSVLHTPLYPAPGPID